MKPSVAIAILLAMIGFMGAVVWSTVQAGEVECEVCMVFDGEEVCRSGRGPGEAEALAEAQASVCGGNVSGMAELIACRGRPPDRQSCDL